MLEAYAKALGDLYRAGVQLVERPEVPSYFHAQRALVAVARSRWVQLAPSFRAKARDMEAQMLLRLRDIASRAAATLRAGSTDRSARRQVKRRRQELEALARAWEDHAHTVLRGEAS
jgi:hypothetical protein